MRTSEALPAACDSGAYLVFPKASDVSARPMLSASWFAFVLRWALQRAHRYTHFVGLVTIRASRDHVGLTIDGGVQMTTEVADRIGPLIRDTDLIGELDDGRLGVLLADADEAAAASVVHRLGETLARIRFAESLVFAIGAASCPANGVDMPSLVAHATDHRELIVCAKNPAA